MVEVLKGVWLGNSPVEAAELEEIYRVGHEWEMTTLCQVVATSAFLAQLEFYCHVSNKMALSIYALPCLAGGRLMFQTYAGKAHARDQQSMIDRIAYQIHMKFNLVLRGSMLALALAGWSSHRVRMTAMVCTATLANLMAWKGLRQKLDPEGKSASLIQKAQRALFVIETAGGLLQGGGVNYLHYGLHAFSMAMSLMRTSRHPDPAPVIESLKEEEIGWEQVKDRWFWEADTSNLIRGVHATPLERPSGVDIADLTTIALQLIDESDPSRAEDREAIRAMLGQEERFTKTGFKDPLLFFTQGITGYVDGIKAKTIDHHEQLLTYAMIITERVKELRDGGQRDELRRLLVDLAVDAHQCHAAWLDVSKEIVNGHTSKGTSMEEDLLTAMAKQREELFAMIRKDALKVVKMDNLRAVDPHRRHNRNLIVTARGWELGFDSYQTAKFDRTIVATEVMEVLYKFATNPETATFYAKYNSDWILEQMKEIVSYPSFHGIGQNRLESWLSDHFGQEVKLPSFADNKEALKKLCWKLGLIKPGSF